MAVIQTDNVQLEHNYISTFCIIRSDATETAEIKNKINNYAAKQLGATRSVDTAVEVSRE